jgi:hypothetical protein
LEKVRTEEPMPPRRVKPDMPADLEIVCLKCLQKEPAARYASAKALADDLERFLIDEPISVRAPHLFDRLKSTLNRSQGLRELKRSAGTIRLLVLGVVLVQLITFLVAWGRPAYPLAALLGVLLPVPVFLGIQLALTGEGWRVPLNAVTRHFWSVRVGIMLGLFATTLVSWMTTPAGSDWNPLTVFPLWSVMLGVVYFGLGIHWGHLYLIGLTFFLLALLMPLRLDLAPFALAVLFGACMFGASHHVQRLAREREQAEKRS